MTAAPSRPAAVEIDRGAWSWALFEWARNPYVLLCIIYVLGPYISTVVIGDPVRGQEVLSGWHKIAGILTALTAPFVGAAADRMGHRKPLLLAVILVLACATALQWLAAPAPYGAPLWLIGTAIVVAGLAFNWTEVLHNSLLTRAAKPNAVSYVSGLGLALGNAGSLLLLVFALFAWALPGQVDWSFLPDAPLFGLDAARHEPSRVVALVCAAWLLIFAVPLFLYTRDADRTGEPFHRALVGGVENVWRTVRKLREYGNVVRFLVARMLYSDGKTAILIFGGVYPAGVMGWGLIEMLAYGVVLSTFAVFGGVVSGWLDHHLGVKRAVTIEIGVTLLCLIGMVSMSREAMFFVVPVEPSAPVWDGPIFRTAPELAYIAVAMVIAISITAAYASSRTMMARLSPPGMSGEVFGLYALSSAATAWLGPLLVEHFTAAYQSQRAGFASIAVLLVAGLAVLLFVKPPADPPRDEA